VFFTDKNDFVVKLIQKKNNVKKLVQARIEKKKVVTQFNRVEMKA